MTRVTLHGFEAAKAKQPKPCFPFANSRRRRSRADGERGQRATVIGTETMARWRQLPSRNSLSEGEHQHQDRARTDAAQAAKIADSAPPAARSVEITWRAHAHGRMSRRLHAIRRAIVMMVPCERAREHAGDLGVGMGVIDRRGSLFDHA